MLTNLSSLTSPSRMTETLASEAAQWGRNEQIKFNLKIPNLNLRGKGRCLESKEEGVGRYSCIPLLPHNPLYLNHSQFLEFSFNLFIRNIKKLSASNDAFVGVMSLMISNIDRSINKVSAISSLKVIAGFLGCTLN